MLSYFSGISAAHVISVPRIHIVPGKDQTPFSVNCIGKILYHENGIAHILSSSYLDVVPLNQSVLIVHSYNINATMED